MTSVHVEVDRDRCMGTGACVFTAPGVFDLEDNIAVVIAEPADDDDRVQDAVAECPMAALRLT